MLTSDFSAASHDTPARQHPRCWAHRLRDLHALQEVQATSLEGLVWARAVKAAYLLAQAWLAQGYERQRAYRERVLLIRALGEQFAQMKGHPCPALAKRLLRQQDAVVVFVRQPGVPADHTLAERSLRPLVVSRKIQWGHP